MATPPKKSSPKTPTRRTTAAKTPAAKRASRPSTPRLTAVEGGADKPAPAAAPAAAAPEAAPEAPEVASVASVALTKKALFAKVAAATGAKKKDVRLIAEATLAVLGQALSEGEDLNLQPLGKVRVVKSRDAGAAEVVTLKLRRRQGGTADGTADGDGDGDFGGDDESGEES